MLLGEPLCRHHVRCRGLQLVLPTTDHAALASHHRLETIFRHFRGVVLFGGTNLGIEHVGAAKEFRFCGPWHQASHRYIGLLQFLPQRIGERIQKGLRAIVNSLVRTRHEARYRSRD